MFTIFRLPEFYLVIILGVMLGFDAACNGSLASCAAGVVVGAILARCLYDE